MSTDEASVKVRVSKKAPRASRKRRMPPKMHKQPVHDQPEAMTIHSPAAPGSEMVMIPVKVLPSGTHKKATDAAEKSAKTSVKSTWAARRAAKKATRLRRRARRYATKAKGATVKVRPKKRTRRTKEPEALAATPLVEVPVAPKPETKRPKARATPARRKKTVAQERTGWLPRPVRTVLKSAFVLLVLLLCGGVVYVFMTGGNSTPMTVTTTSVSATAPSAITPRQPGPNVAESAAVQMVSSPTRPGGDASLSVKTLPGSACTITVTYTDKKLPSTAAGLLPALADDFGAVSWNWKVDAWAPVGSWPITVTCAHNKKSAVVQTTLEVAGSAPASAAN